MLPLSNKDRVRMLSAVANRGATFNVMRVMVITASLGVLLCVPLLGLARVDLWGGDHLLLGKSVDFFSALKGSVIAMAVIYGATFASNIVVGRFFCGWGCPVGFVSRFGEEADRSKSKVLTILTHVKGALFVGTFVAAVMLWWVDGKVMIEGSLQAKLIVSGVFLFLSIGGLGHAMIWRFGFCLNVCPIGLYYRYVTSRAPVGIVFNEVPNPCIECGACEKICPVYLDPKSLGVEVVQKSTSVDDEPERYGDAECLRCGDCIEACKMVFAKEECAIPPLRFGKVEESKPKDLGSKESGDLTHV